MLVVGVIDDDNMRKVHLVGAIFGIAIITLARGKSVVPVRENDTRQTRITEADMEAILKLYNNLGSDLCNDMARANWDVQTHVNEPGYAEIQVIIVSISSILAVT